MPSAPARSAYRHAALLPAALLLVAAHKPPPPTGDLILDAANPVVAVEIAGVPLRLRVDMDQQDSIALNPAAAARLPVTWERGPSLDVGRVRLSSRVALAAMRIAGRDVPSQVAEHGRDCCAGTDGAIGPDLLPYATVTWRRLGAPPANRSITLQMIANPLAGLVAPSGPQGVQLRFGVAQPRSIGTAAAGAALARKWAGRWGAQPERASLAFGVQRPARVIAFGQPGLLAGFQFDRLLVRTSDFAGQERLPPDPAGPGELVVSRRLARQPLWSSVMIGADRLGRCTEIVYAAIPRTLTLRCAFDRP